MCNFMTLACLCSSAERFEPYLVKNPEDRFSRDPPHVIVSFVVLWLIGLL